MKTKQEIINILKKELHFLKENVQFERPIGFFDFITLEDYLTEKLGIKVDLVTEDALKPVIKPYIMREVMYV